MLKKNKYFTENNDNETNYYLWDYYFMLQTHMFCSYTTRRDGMNGTEGTEDPYFDMKMIQRPVFNNNNHILR